MRWCADVVHAEQCELVGCSNTTAEELAEAEGQGLGVVKNYQKRLATWAALGKFVKLRFTLT